MNKKNLKNIVALDIDAGSIKVLLGDVTKEGIIVKKAVSSLIPENVFHDGQVINLSILESIFGNLLRINKIKAKQCFCTFESSQIISREVLVPNTPHGNFQEIAKFEMAQFLPIELKNYVVQSKHVREVDVDGKPFIEALTTAVPKQMVDVLHQLIQNVGLKPMVLDTHGNAISKLFEGKVRVNGEQIDDKTVAFLEFGYENIYLSIFQKGKFKLSRLVTRGTSEIDSNISKFFQIPIEEAATKKMNIKNLLDESTELVQEEARLNNVVRSSLESWFDEIDKTFRYYASRNKGAENIDLTFVYGAITNIVGMPELVTNYFRAPAERINKIENVTWPTKETPKEISDYFYALGTMYRK